MPSIKLSKPTRSFFSFSFDKGPFVYYGKGATQIKQFFKESYMTHAEENELYRNIPVICNH